MQCNRQMFVILWHIYLIYDGVQILTQIRGSVHLTHLAFVIQTPTVLRLHLTCVPVTRPAVTGVNAMMDTSVMGLIAQVRYNWIFLKTGCDVVIILTASKCILYITGAG